MNQVNKREINWIKVFNYLFEVINTQGSTYYGGPKFLETIRDINYSVPSYHEYINQRSKKNQSTTRKSYYYDLLMAQSEEDRIKIVNSILDKVSCYETEKTSIIQELLGQHQTVQGPRAQTPVDEWNADGLDKYLRKMDNSITKGEYKSTLTLAYTCLEGFYKSYISKKIPEKKSSEKVLKMSEEICGHIKEQFGDISYPKGLITLFTTATNAICEARNNFSYSHHSKNTAEKWMAIYARDNVNSIIRMLLCFM